MSDKLIKQVAVELEQLSNLLQTYRPLISRCATIRPDPIELSALAAMLHAFYTGIENILKRIAMERDGGLPRSDTWHRQLLDAMTRCSLSRPEVISTSLKDLLRMYLDFRHVFRHAYTFELRWEKMAGLVFDCDRVITATSNRIGYIFQSIRNQEKLKYNIASVYPLPVFRSTLSAEGRQCYGVRVCSEA